MTNQVIDISEPGQWETILSYYQSSKMWQAELNPIYKRAKDKEIARYKYLRSRALGNQAN